MATRRFGRAARAAHHQTWPRDDRSGRRDSGRGQDFAPCDSAKRAAPEAPTAQDPGRASATLGYAWRRRIKADEGARTAAARAGRNYSAPDERHRLATALGPQLLCGRRP